MVDNRNPCGSFPTVLAREKIADNKLNISSGIGIAEHVLEAPKVAGGPNKAAEIGKAMFEENFDDL
jgi:hypothetical protein